MFRCRGAKLRSNELTDSEVQELQLESVLDSKKIVRLDAASATVLDRRIPDIVVVCSDEVFHGFAAYDKRDAYALHIRVNDNMNLPIRDPLVHQHKRQSDAKSAKDLA